MANKQNESGRIYQELCDRIRKWAWETKPDDVRVVDERVPVEHYRRLETIIAQVSIDNKVVDRFASLMMVAVMSAVMNCFPRMDKAAFLSDLDDLVAMALLITAMENEKWLQVSKEQILANMEAETPTVH